MIEVPQVHAVAAVVEVGEHQERGDQRPICCPLPPEEVRHWVDVEDDPCLDPSLWAEAYLVGLGGGRCWCASLAVNPAKRRKKHAHARVQRNFAVKLGGGGRRLGKARADACAGRLSTTGFDLVLGEKLHCGLWRLDLGAKLDALARNREDELWELHEFRRRGCRTEGNVANSPVWAAGEHLLFGMSNK